MADAPMGPEITLIDYNHADGTVSPFPLLKCRNIYVLPGVPSLVGMFAKWTRFYDGFCFIGDGGGGGGVIIVRSDAAFAEKGC